MDISAATPLSEGVGGSATIGPDGVGQAGRQQLGDPLDMAGGQVRTQLDDDIATLSIAAVESEGKRVCHGESPVDQLICPRDIGPV